MFAPSQLELLPAAPVPALLAPDARAKARTLEFFTAHIRNPNTRKASVVRSLTGCFNRSVRDIQPLGGKPLLRLYARVGSLQDTRCAPEDFIAEAARMRCNAVLCCLAPGANPDHRERFPDAQSYLAAFKAAGWRICSIENCQW